MTDTVRDLQVSLAELGPAAAPVTRLHFIRGKDAEKVESREIKDEQVQEDLEMRSYISYLN